MTAATGDGRRPSDTNLLDGYRQLATVLGVLLAERGLDEVLARIAATLRGFTPCDDIVIWGCADGELRAMFARGGDAKAIRRLRIPVGLGLTGLAAETREPILSNQAHLDPRARQVPDTELGPEAVMCVPLLVRQQLIGVLSVYRMGEDCGFDGDEFELTRHFAEVAAIAIDNARTRGELEHLASTDDLTGLANRRRFRQELARELAAAARYGRDVSLLLLDLDGFKGVNDRFGHDRGDEVLQTIASLLARRTRKCDLVARIGGDEFALLLPGTRSERAAELAGRLGQSIAAKVGDLGIRASVGVASYPATEGDQLLTEADRRLYASKREHGGLRLTWAEGSEAAPVLPAGRTATG
ncbi:MAG TPA: sensor domain-containing diguanylate cyclase [Gaiellaceae bacterium]|jgi:diguanylate cyclase (GGDEF)-like protein|nr:sensor domain-containing diguanylate cyclase [Gaiellaceae bacterium]